MILTGIGALGITLKILGALSIVPVEDNSSETHYCTSGFFFLKETVQT